MWPREVAELSERRRVGIWSLDLGLEFLLGSSCRGLLLLHLSLLLLRLLLGLPLAFLLGKFTVAFFSLSRQLRVGRRLELQIGSGT